MVILDSKAEKWARKPNGKLSEDEITKRNHEERQKKYKNAFTRLAMFSEVKKYQKRDNYESEARRN